MKYRKKPVVIDAVQWRKPGDHEAVSAFGDPTHFICTHCGLERKQHGWIETLEGGHIVCPGDWIITGVKGEHYPCKPDIFDATYEPVEEEPARTSNEPDFSAQISIEELAETKDWLQIVGEDFKRRGAAYFRTSVDNETRAVLLEGWCREPTELPAPVFHMTLA